MAVEYHNASEDVYELMNRVLEGYYPQLDTLEPRPRIDILMAVSDGEAPAVKHMGHMAAATIELIRPKEKARTGLDMRITIDKVRWLEMDEEQQLALLHHELAHPEPQHDKEGVLRVDGYGRPKFKLRLDDWCLTGFKETVRVFGPKAIERRSLDDVERMLRS